MSAITKALPNPPANYSTTLTAAAADDDLTISLDSATGLGTEGVGVIYSKNADGDITTSSIEFIHWTGVSGNDLTLDDTGDRGLSGSANGAQAHSLGDTFEVWVHPEYHFYDFAVVEHSADGTHSDITADSVDVGTGAIATTSKASAGTISNQNNLENGTATQITLGTELFDPGNAFASSAYTFQVSGIYLVVYSIRFTNVIADKAYSAAAYVDGTPVAIATGHASLAANLVVNGARIISVTADQELKLYGTSNSGDNTVDVSGVTYSTFLDVHLLSAA